MTALTLGATALPDDSRQALKRLTLMMLLGLAFTLMIVGVLVFAALQAVAIIDAASKAREVTQVERTIAAYGGDLNYVTLDTMTALTALLLVGQRSGPAVILSLVVAGLGAVVVIFRGDLGALLRFEIGRGELIYFVGCVAYAFYTPLLRRFSRGEPSLVQSFWTLLATAICIALSGIPDIAATDWLHLPAVVWWVVLYLAVGPTAICFFLIQFASLRLPAPKVIAYGYLTPAFVILFEALAGHGLPGVAIIIGAAVTVLGLIVLAVLRD